MTIHIFNATNMNKVRAKFTKFPGGETLVNIDTKGDIRARDRINVIFRFKSADDIMNLLQVHDILAYHGNLHLTMTYVPYARQDRRAAEGDSHSLAVFARVINSLKWESITIHDPHSDVVEALFPNAIIHRQWDLMLDVAKDGRYDAIVAPDMGAAKKASKLAELCGIPLIQCIKTRDPKTGALSDPRVLDKVFESDQKVKLLVVDDICDGGYTFVQLAKPLLADMNVKQLDLCVTHGIFSKGLSVLHDAGYSKVACINLMNGDW